MPVANRYFLTALPSLPPPGEPVGYTVFDLIDHVADQPRAREIVQAVLLMRDLALWQQHLAGVPMQIEPAVLSAEQVNGTAPLPDFLAGPAAQSGAGRTAADAVWTHYARHVQQAAAQLGSTFLDAWIRFEVSLRNTLARERSRILETEAATYLLAAELEFPDGDLSRFISEWVAARDPLAAERVADTWRLTWLDAHDARFSFSDDELGAFAARLMILERWERIMVDAEQTGALS